MEVTNTGEFNGCSFNNPANKSITYLIKQQSERESENREQAWDGKIMHFPQVPGKRK